MVIDKTTKAFKDQKKNAFTGLDDFVSSKSKVGLEMLQGSAAELTAGEEDYTDDESSV